MSAIVTTIIMKNIVHGIAVRIQPERSPRGAQ
jgi:hypothetical protein